MIKQFRDFITRGNVVDLAVGVVIGGAFGAVITSFTNDILMAIIGGIFGKPNFDSLVFELGDSIVAYGKFLTALVNFLLIAAAIFFAVVVPLNKLAERRANGEDDAEPTNDEKMIALLEQIANK
ncbi:MAG: large conductance mechanosensitive channel protein MscL [Microthrixaceae bacterium]